MTNQAKMQVKLIDYASAPLEKLYAAFRTCYSADTPIEIWDKIEAGEYQPRKDSRIHRRTAEDRPRLAAGTGGLLVWDLGRLAIAVASVCAPSYRHQLRAAEPALRQVQAGQARLRAAGIMVARAGIDDEFSQLLEHTSELYARALKAGIPAEDARFILPNAAPTNFHVMVNFAEMLHICDLRLCVRAQWEIRRMVALMRAEIKKFCRRSRSSCSPNAARTGWAIATSRSTNGENARSARCGRISRRCSSCTIATADARLATLGEDEFRAVEEKEQL